MAAYAAYAATPWLAEEVGFEPTVLIAHAISSRAH